MAIFASEEDATFAVHARADVPELLGEVKRLRLLIEEALVHVSNPEVAASFYTRVGGQ